MTKKLSKKGFTLVELIIVIAIIAILAVTAFLLLTKRLAKARDASRSSNLANIENALQISLTDAGTLPKPDNYTLIYASGTTNVVGYQGDFGEGAKDAVGNINSAPKDGDDYFLYYLSNDLKSYQLGALMENEVAYNSNIVSAVDYSSRFINVKGSQLGMLFDANKSPVNKLGLTGVDIQNTTSSYTAYFDNTNKVSGTGFILKSMRGGGNLAFGLVGYWSFDEIGAGNTVADISKYGNTGYLSGATLPTLTEGKVGSGMYFNGSGYIQTKINYADVDNCTVSLRIKVLDKNRGYAFIDGRIRPHIDPLGLALSFRSWKHNLGGGNQRDMYTNFSTGDWIFFVGVEDNEYLKTYINGTFFKKYKKTGILSPNFTPRNLQIGHDGDSLDPMRYTVAVMDDLRFYDRALSDSEVKALYDATK